jgi:Large ribosomal RNA subunit accumulation protein YceD
VTAPLEFSRPLALDRLGAAPYEQEVAATAEECAALARRLGIPAVLALSGRFRLHRAEAGRIDAVAELRARLVRECVVTLDEFEADVTESFRVAFVPEGSESEDDDPEADDEIPYAGAAIDLGEAAAEQLALTLDPYPHRPGAELPAEAQESAESPFALLARRRGVA